MRIIESIKAYYNLYLTNWKMWIIAVACLPILIIILIADIIRDCLVFLLFILEWLVMKVKGGGLQKSGGEVKSFD